MHPWHATFCEYGLAFMHVDIHTTPPPWKLTPFGAVSKESYINDSDGQALPGQLSANTIQRGHLGSKPMTEGADRLKESITHQIGSFFSRRLCSHWSFTSIMIYQTWNRWPSLNHRNCEMKGCLCQNDCHWWESLSCSRATLSPQATGCMRASSKNFTASTNLDCLMCANFKRSRAA